MFWIGFAVGIIIGGGAVIGGFLWADRDRYEDELYRRADEE